MTHSPHSRTSPTLRRAASAAGLVALLLAGLPPLHAQEQLVLKLASREVADSPTGQQLAAFARWVHERTRGAVRVKLLLGGRLGSVEQQVQRTVDGTLQAFAGTAHELAAAVPELHVLEAPGVLSDHATVDSRLDGPVRARVAALLQARNLVFGFWGAGAFRAWFTRQAPVGTPAALDGMRVARRTSPAAGVRVSAAYGVTPVELPDPVRAGALEANRVDALDAEVLDALASEAWRGARHLTLCEHAYVPRLVVYSKRWFDGLPEQLQKELAAPPDELVRDARTAATTANAEAARLLENSGVQLRTCTAAEHRTFVEPARPATDALARALGADAMTLLAAARD